MSRATRKNSIQSQLSTINKSLERELRAATGADSPAIRQAGNALARAMREQLGRAGAAQRVSISGKSRRVRGEPSAPGEAPRKQSGSLRRTIKNAVVEGTRRVGTGSFRGRLLEFGVVATAVKPRQSKRKGAKKGQMTKGSHGLTIAPRPWARPALAAAAPKMGDAIVSELQSRHPLDGAARTGGR